MIGRPVHRLCTDRRAERRIDWCIDMCIDVCIDMCADTGRLVRLVIWIDHSGVGNASTAALTDPAVSSGTAVSIALFANNSPSFSRLQKS